MATGERTDREKGADQQPDLDAEKKAEPASRWRKYAVWIGGILVLGAGAWGIWRWRAVPAVALISPTIAQITESIASSGRVGGVTETIVGAQAQGIVARVLVREGDRVRAGQQLATLQNDVARAQVAQAEQAINTARAQLAQTTSGPLRSEVEAAAEQVRQAEAQVRQQRAAVNQAERAVVQARAQLNQARAERDLARRTLNRRAELVETGDIPRAEYDQALASSRSAEEQVNAAQSAIALEQARVEAARAGVNSAQANVATLRARLQTVRTGARPEEIQIARQRVIEAERALRVAREQAQNAAVVAPFDGIVTEVIAEPGQAANAQGVVSLVSNELEIRLDVDESNLSDLRIGQSAVISSSAFPGSTFQGTISELGAAVNVTRGTIEVTVTPQSPPEWLRPGQTVNVNIITDRAAERVLIPATAISRSGDRSVVFLVKDDRAFAQPVLTRPPTAQGVPVLAGLTVDDRIIADARNINEGDRVRVTGSG